MHEDGRKVYCDEGDDLYEISYNSANGGITAIKLNNPRILKEYFEKVQNEDGKSPMRVVVGAKSETHSLEKAARIFKEYFEKMAKRVSDSFYDELNNRENWWYAKFIPAAKVLKLTCIREVPVGYSHNLVFVEEEGGYPKFFAFIKAKEYNAAWEKAFILFRDYINDCNDTLDYIDSENCTRASRKE